MVCLARAATTGNGVYGEGNFANGVHGKATARCVRQGRHGVHGVSRPVWCVWREPDGAVVGVSSNLAGLYGERQLWLCCVLNGKVKISGNLEKDEGSFKIDHPLDPANKYLCHSFVESPDMKNVYDGVVVLDGKGKAEIELPDWFGILNKDFRYQITAIGAPGPNLYIAEEISKATNTIQIQ